MTRDEILAEADPQFLKGRQRERRWIGGLGALAILALIAAAVSFVLTLKTEVRVTNIEKSACAKNTTDPTPECEEIRQEIARNEGIEGPCILHQRVDGTKGRNCPRFYVSRGREVQANSKPVQNLELGATNSPSQAHAPSVVHQSPAPSGGGPSPPTKTTPPQHHSPSAPPSTGAEGPSAPTGSAGTTTPTITSPVPTASPTPSPVIETPDLPQAPSVPALIPKALEEVREAVQDVGETVDQAQCGVRGVLVGPCPP